MERFTRTISLSCNVLATPAGLDGSRNLAPGVATTIKPTRRVPGNQLGGSDGRWHVFPSKKGGAEVGNTKKGKGTKIMLMIDGEGIPLSAFITSASTAEVNTVETLIDNRLLEQMPERLLYDKAADADWLREALASRQIELISPHRRGRKKPPLQDGRSLKRYRKRFKVERTISWLFNCRRLTMRYEYYAHLFEGFVQLGCLFMILKWF